MSTLVDRNVLDIYESGYYVRIKTDGKEGVIGVRYDIFQIHMVPHIEAVKGKIQVELREGKEVEPDNIEAIYHKGNRIAASSTLSRSP